MALALLFEAVLGWPRWLYAWIRHPVVWIGALINLLDARLNRDSNRELTRRVLGTFTLLAVVGVSILAAITISTLMPDSTWGIVAEALIASSLLASRSLYEHVAAVMRPLADNDLAAAREAVSHIVGRDPSALDAPAVARASLETLAENASDGVVAPLFWGALFGLPGIAAYKAINTLDSMIGHRTPRHESFGWASARTDDIVNLIPARLTALAFALAGLSIAAARVASHDAGLHRSPNAGWPESALAGCLGVRLSGPRVYDGVPSGEAWVNGDCPDPDHNDMRKGLRLYTRAIALLWVVLVLVAIALTIQTSRV